MKLTNVFLSLFFVLFTTNSFGKKVLVLGTFQNSQTYNVAKIVFDEISKHSSEVKFIVERYPGRRSLVEANSGRIDGEVGRVENIKSISSIPIDNLIKLKESLGEIEYILIGKKETKIEKISWDSLKKYKVAIARGAMILEKKLSKESRVFFSGMNKAYYMVIHGEADFLVTIKVYGISLGVKNMPKQLKEFKPSLETVKMFPLIHKKHANLIPHIEATIKRLRESGAIKRALEKKLPLFYK